MMTCPIYGKIKFMLQTTNQYLMEYPFGCYNDTSGEIVRTLKETLLVAVWFIVP